MVHQKENVITGPGRLDDRTLRLIREVLALHPKVTSALLFGSRAIGSARVASDIDIALDGISTRLEAERIRRELEDLPLPYRFDVVALQTIDDTDLLEHIERYGMEITGTEAHT